MLDVVSLKERQAKVLLLAFHSYAGMGPYVISIVNSFSPEDNVRFFLIEREDRYYTRNIKDELRGMAKIIRCSTPSKLKTLYNIAIDGRSEFRRQINDFCMSENINIVHDLTGCTDYGLTKQLSEQYKLIYTVHDLQPHEAKKSFFKKWKQDVLYKRVFKSIDYAPVLLTNSLTQLENQRRIYPNKNNVYSPFPSLITDEIFNGVKVAPEISKLQKYILFFGRIEKYKGLSILVEAFSESKLSENVKLVIAGRGEFQIPENSRNIIFINRYIEDDEIASLYKNAICVVYPYISATQSGVLSVASYFRTPIIASDVPFFSEVLGRDYCGLFHNGDAKDLESKINKFVSLSYADMAEIKEKLWEIYRMQYDAKSQKKRLCSIYLEFNAI